jgi:hypothetical protein
MEMGREMEMAREMEMERKMVMAREMKMESEIAEKKSYLSILRCSNCLAGCSR